MQIKKDQKNSGEDQKDDDQLNKQLEGNDKSPGEEDGKGEKVTKFDLKNKTVDADPEEDQKK